MYPLVPQNFMFPLYQHPLAFELFGFTYYDAVINVISCYKIFKLDETILRHFANIYLKPNRTNSLERNRNNS